MEKTDVYNMRVVPLMRKINIVKDGCIFYRTSN